MLSVERTEGHNLLTFFWKGAADLNTCDVWIWWEGKDGSGYPLVPCEFGGKCSVNVPDYIKEVGFIVRTCCSDPCQNFWGSAAKDCAVDRTANMTGPETEIFLRSGDPSQYRSCDGGKTLTQIRFFNLAGIAASDRIRVFIEPGCDGLADGSTRVTVRDGEREIPVSKITDVWENRTSAIINLSEELDISKEYSVEIEGYGKRIAVPTEIFDSQTFIDSYTYDGDDLGSVILANGSTRFKVWAPTAGEVVLCLYEKGDGGQAFAKIPMERQDKGVWCAVYPCGHGTYYTYEVTTAGGTQEAVDPYARTSGVNGNRGMVIDLHSTDPEDFKSDSYVNLRSYNDAVIWEVHVRDFSNSLASSRYPGKYLAFTETGLKNKNGIPAGTDYLRNLGITHVHLQPVSDYATVDETRLDEPQFNWGYDPKNYNVPEGSYSTDPYNGETRVKELKQMVRSLHNAGLGVVMDVVYNHTYDINSCLNRIVPYYYYRYSISGAPSNGSGCGNETASERFMFRKYMIDSVKYWLTEYHLDGFRFDLMAIHDLETMARIEKTVHEINPNAIIYGEGWSGGQVALDSSRQATQYNIGRIGITNSAAGSVAVFNDSIRDGLKGGVFNLTTKGYINGAPSAENAGKVIFGLTGGCETPGICWSVGYSMVVNYMSAHDNYTLWDKLRASNLNASREELLRMNRLGASIIMLSKGTPFMLAGEEMLRTKDGDGNSYMSSDRINNIDWDVLSPESDQYGMSVFYSGLMVLRRECSFLGNCDVRCRLLDGFVIEASYRIHGNLVGIAVINPNDSSFSYNLPYGDWRLLLENQRFLHGETVISGRHAVAGKSVLFARK